MKLVLAEPKYLKDSVFILSELVNDVQLKVTKDKIEVISMDPANVAMVIFRLLSSAFVEYNVDGDKTIGVSLDSLKNVLRRAKPSDTVVIELDEDKNKLKVQLRGDSTRTFNLGLIDIEEKEHKIPDLNFSANIETNTIFFDEAIEDMDVVSDSVNLSSDKNNFIIQATGNIHEGNVVMNNDKDTSIILNGDSAKAKYSIEYLKKIIKGSKLVDKVKLQFSNDYPLRVEYNVKDKLQLVTILAPRVSE